MAAGDRREALERLAQKTDLLPSTCAELIHKGWVYIEGPDCKPRWEAPLDVQRKC